jgi:hypothetical protein
MTPSWVSTSRIENGNRDEQFAWKRRAEAVGTRNGKAAESDRGTPIAERQRVLAGEGPHAGGRPAVHQNRSQRSYSEAALLQWMRAHQRLSTSEQ